MTASFYTDWVYWLIVVTWIPWVVFVVRYWSTVPRWWRDEIGRGVMSPALAVTILLTFALVTRAFDLPGYVSGAIRVVMFTAVIVAGWLLLFALLGEQRRARRNECPRRRSTDHKENAP